MEAGAPQAATRGARDAAAPGGRHGGSEKEGWVGVRKIEMKRYVV